MPSGKTVRFTTPSPGMDGIERMSANAALTVHISDKAVQSLLAHAGNNHPVECCGVIVGRVYDSDIHADNVTPGQNIARGNRRRMYQLDWQTLFGAIQQCRRSEAQIVGFYHSHPNGSDHFSESDLALAWDGVLYVILRAPYEDLSAISIWRTIDGTAARADVSVYSPPRGIPMSLGLRRR